MMQKSRVYEIDIVKAIAIILVVIGHSGAPFTSFIYLFHMAVFFIASGYFYNETRTNNINGLVFTIKNKIMKIWLIYFVWSCIFTILNNCFISINIYTNNIDIINILSGNFIGTSDVLSFEDIIKRIIKAIYFSCDTQLGGTFWFFKILFIVSICYATIDFIIKKIKCNSYIIQTLLSIIFLLFGYICSKDNISLHGLAVASSCYILYHLGYLFRKLKTNVKKENDILYVCMCILSMLILVLLNQFGTISLGNNKYENPAFYLICSISGWCLLYSIAYFLKKYSKVRGICEYVGKNTLPIMILHFLSFKIINFVVLKIYNLPIYCLAAFPNLYGNRGIWWVAYSMIGILFPLMINEIYKRLYKYITNLIQNT